MSDQPFEIIFEAVECGTIQEVKRYIKNSTDFSTINGRYEHHLYHYSPTLLHLAARNPSVEVLQYLVSQGADVNAKNNKGDTPLHCAAIYNPSVEVLQYLVSQGADVNAKNKYGGTPLYNAASNHNDAILKYLVSQGADAGSGFWSQMLCNAIESKHNVDVLKYLISRGADVNEKDCFGKTSLHYAAWNSSWKL